MWIMDPAVNTVTSAIPMPDNLLGRGAQHGWGDLNHFLSQPILWP